MKTILKRSISLFLAVIVALPAQSFAQILPYMPLVGTLVATSAKPYSLPYVVGMRFSSDDIFNFTFVLNRGDMPAEEKVLREEAAKIGKYFLAALTIPEKDLWVNLSPYESNRIITPELSRTDLGKDLLGEDYVLKQLAASLTHPDSESGKEYWGMVDGVGARSPRPGQGNPAPTNLTKVWITPDKIKMLEASDRVVITEATLKASCEDKNPAMRSILPAIEKEVNTGRHFAQLRQLYSAIILAGWFKKKLKDTVLNEIYFNQKKTVGAENNDPALKEKVYNEYVKAFNQGVYKVIKNSKGKSQKYGVAFGNANKIVKRTYFCGGVGELDRAIHAADTAQPATVTIVNDAAAEAADNPNTEAIERGTEVDFHQLGIVEHANDSLKQLLEESIDYVLDLVAYGHSAEAIAPYIESQIVPHMIGGDRQSALTPIVIAENAIRLSEGISREGASQWLKVLIGMANDADLTTWLSDASVSMRRGSIKVADAQGGKAHTSIRINGNDPVTIMRELREAVSLAKVNTDKRIESSIKLAAVRLAWAKSSIVWDSCPMIVMDDLEDTVNDALSNADIFAAKCFYGDRRVEGESRFAVNWQWHLMTPETFSDDDLIDAGLSKERIQQFRDDLALAKRFFPETLPEPMVAAIIGAQKIPGMIKKEARLREAGKLKHFADKGYMPHFSLNDYETAYGKNVDQHRADKFMWLVRLATYSAQNGTGGDIELGKELYRAIMAVGFFAEMVGLMSADNSADSSADDITGIDRESRAAALATMLSPYWANTDNMRYAEYTDVISDLCDLGRGYFLHEVKDEERRDSIMTLEIFLEQYLKEDIAKHLDARRIVDNYLHRAGYIELALDSSDNDFYQNIVNASSRRDVYRIFELLMDAGKFRADQRDIAQKTAERIVYNCGRVSSDGESIAVAKIIVMINSDEKFAGKAQPVDTTKRPKWLKNLLQDWELNRNKILKAENNIGIRNQISAAPAGFPDKLSDALIKVIWYAHDNLGDPIHGDLLAEKDGFYYLKVDPATNRDAADELDRVRPKVECIMAVAIREGMPRAVAEKFAQWMCDRMHAGESYDASNNSSLRAVYGQRVISRVMIEKFPRIVAQLSEEVGRAIADVEKIRDIKSRPLMSKLYATGQGVVNAFRINYGNTNDITSSLPQKQYETLKALVAGNIQEARSGVNADTAAVLAQRLLDSVALQMRGLLLQYIKFDIKPKVSATYPNEPALVDAIAEGIMGEDTDTLKRKYAALISPEVLSKLDDFMRQSMDSIPAWMEANDIMQFHVDTAEPAVNDVTAVVTNNQAIEVDLAGTPAQEIVDPLGDEQARLESIKAARPFRLMHSNGRVSFKPFTQGLTDDQLIAYLDIKYYLGKINTQEFREIDLERALREVSIRASGNMGRDGTYPAIDTSDLPEPVVKAYNQAREMNQWISDLANDWDKNRFTVLISPSGKGIRTELGDAPTSFPKELNGKLLQAIRYAHDNFGGPLHASWLERKNGFYYIHQGIDLDDPFVKQEILRVGQKIEYIQGVAEQEGMPEDVARKFAQWMCDRMHAGIIDSAKKAVTGVVQNIVDARRAAAGKKAVEAEARVKRDPAMLDWDDTAQRATILAEQRQADQARAQEDSRYALAQNAAFKAAQVISTYGDTPSAKRVAAGKIIGYFGHISSADRPFIAQELNRLLDGANRLLDAAHTQRTIDAATVKARGALIALAELNNTSIKTEADNGGFDFAATQDKSKVELTDGGFKASAKKSTAYLSSGKVAGFKLAIVAIRY